jgi:hypothetical protein
MGRRRVEFLDGSNVIVITRPTNIRLSGKRDLLAASEATGGCPRFAKAYLGRK